MKAVFEPKFWWPFAVGTVAAFLAWHLLGQYRNDLEARFLQMTEAQQENQLWVDVVVSRMPLRTGDTLKLNMLQYRRIDASLSPHGAIYPDDLDDILGRRIALNDNDEIPPGRPLQWHQLHHEEPEVTPTFPVDHTLMTLPVHPEDSHIGLWAVGDYIQGYQRVDSSMRKVGRPYQIFALDGQRRFDSDQHRQAPRHATLLLPIRDALQLASLTVHGPVHWVQVSSVYSNLPVTVAPPNYIHRIVPKGEACVGLC